MLSLTCDNASNNDKMVEILEVLIDDFPGAANQIRCFLHIINLVVKSIIKQFDLPKAKKISVDDDKKKGAGDGSGNEDAENDEIDEIDERVERDKRLDQAREELLKLAGEVDIEGGLMENSEEDDDNVEGWIDERDEMTEDEIRELSESVGPVRLLLTKVSYIRCNA